MAKRKRNEKYDEIDNAMQTYRTQILNMTSDSPPNEMCYYKLVINGFNEELENKLEECWGDDSLWKWEIFVHTCHHDKPIIRYATKFETVDPNLKIKELFSKYGFPYFIFKIDLRWSENQDVDRMNELINFYNESISDDPTINAEISDYFVRPTNFKGVVIRDFLQSILINQITNTQVRSDWINQIANYPQGKVDIKSKKNNK